MTVTNLGPDVQEIPGGWRVHRADGTSRTVFKRPDGRYAVFAGTSTDRDRHPRLGYTDSWRTFPEQAIDWARTF